MSKKGIIIIKQINKIRHIKEAVSLIKSGFSIMVGGFGLIGYPEEMVEVLAKSDVDELTIISNDMGSPGVGLGKLLLNGQIKSIIGTHFGKNSDVAKYLNLGKVKVNVVPQGNFVEAIRAGGVGITAFYTPVGVGTILAEGKETRTFNGVETILEKSIRADVALIKAHKADTLGNLVYYKTARNLNPIMAAAAKLTIAEVDEIVPAGDINPEVIITPHIYIDILVQRSGRR